MKETKEIYDIETNKERGSISIIRYDSNTRLYKNGWYEMYRDKDIGDLENVNKILRNIYITPGHTSYIHRNFNAR